MLALGYARIHCDNGGYLTIDSCEFINGNIAIQIEPGAKEVSIKNSKFTGFKRRDIHDCVGSACIIIPTDVSIIPTDVVKLCCDGNTFEDNEVYPIAEAYVKHIIRSGFSIDDGRYITRTNSYELINNILKGYNGTNKKEVIDANKIYRTVYDTSHYLHFEIRITLPALIA